VFAWLFAKLFGSSEQASQSCGHRVLGLSGEKRAASGSQVPIEPFFSLKTAAKPIEKA